MELICPACTTVTPERVDVRTLARTGDVLACECGRRYPIIDGIPIVVADPSRLLRDDPAALVDLPVDVAAQVIADGADDAPHARLAEHLSTYFDAHWGDRAEPAPEHAGFGARPL